jgi:hypothetical protein
MQAFSLRTAASWLRHYGSQVWSGWPERAYQRQRYRHRLAAVQEHLAETLDWAPAGLVRIISICAGDGRDVIGVLRSHKRRTDVAAWLVELNHQSVSAGLRSVKNAGLEDTVKFLSQDATLFATYKDIAPSDIVLVCGVWGHVPVHQRSLLVRGLGSLCKSGGTVIWTRGISKGIGRLHDIQSAFAAESWEEVRVSVTFDRTWAVASYRYCGSPTILPQTGRVFSFQRTAGRNELSVC